MHSGGPGGPNSAPAAQLAPTELSRFDGHQSVIGQGDHRLVGNLELAVLQRPGHGGGQLEFHAFGAIGVGVVGGPTAPPGARGE